MSLSWCAELMLNPVVRWRVKRRSATHPNLDALTRGLKPHGYLQETAPRSSKTSKLQRRPLACCIADLWSVGVEAMGTREFIRLGRLKVCDTAGQRPALRRW